MTAAPVLSHTEHMNEIRQITIEELTRDATQVFDQVVAGQDFEIMKSGHAIAVLHALDPEERKFRELVKAGIIPPDIVQQQREVLDRLRTTRRPLPGHKSASDTLIEMRREERS